MRKWKALLLFTTLTIMVITYAVWAYWPRMIDDETLVFHKNADRHDRIAAQAYLKKHPPEITWEDFSDRMANPHNREKFIIHAINFTWSDGQTFLELLYPNEEVTLKVESNGEWKKVNTIDYTKPDALPLIGRLFQDHEKKVEAKTNNEED